MLKNAVICANLGSWDYDTIGMMSVRLLDPDNLQETLAVVINEYYDPMKADDLICLTKEPDRWIKLKEEHEINECVQTPFDEKFVIFDDTIDMVFIGIIWVE